MSENYCIFDIDGISIHVEIVSQVPNDFYLIDTQKDYDIFRKDERTREDVNHYFLAVRR